ncbi:MAG: short-chain dehydrogenase [Chloroflexi bacterium RBG_13_68_17]|nr:MAG: short-chain dehydrogenase [Chloroflexi bacterium RBG_13_68_17]
MTFALTDKVAIVTGGSRGIGRAIALAFSQAGAAVVVASRKQEGVEAVAAEIRAAGGRALAVAAHVGQEEAVAALVERTVESFGGVDIVVNNAGTNPHFGPLLTASPAQWDKILEVNLRGAFLLSRQAVPHMKARGGGKILNVASLAGLRPSPGMGVYSVSKAGLIMLTQVLARELGPDKIQVNAIAPGVIKTRLSRALWEAPAMADGLAASTPLGRLGEVDDVVGAALYLVSPLSDYVTGEVIVIDGGMNLMGGIG